MGYAAGTTTIHGRSGWAGARGFAAATGICIALLGPHVGGGEPAYRELLTAGFDSGTNANQIADRMYRELLPRDGKIPVGHAYGLVLANQHRYSGALKIMDGVIAANQGSVEARALRLWLQLVVKKNGPAIVELTTLVGLLPAYRGEHPGEADAWIERLGQCHGFLEATRGSLEPGKAIEKDLLQILAGLAPGDLGPYNRGREGVLAEHARRTAEKIAIASNRAVAAELDRQNERQSLDAQTTQIAERLEDLETEGRDQEDRFRSQRNDIDRRVPGVLTNLRQSQRNVDWIAIDLAGLSAQAAALDARIRLEADPLKRVALVQERNAIVSFLALQQSQIGYALDSRAIARTNASFLQRDRFELEDTAYRERVRLESQQSNLMRAQSREPVK